MASYQKAFDAIDQFIEHRIKASNIPGLAMALTDREKLLRVSTYGFADVAAQAPITPDTLFEVGSLGKPFTNIALLQLREEGKFDLQTPVTQYLPWFHVRSDYPPITGHHLMTHTAGIIRGTDLAPHGLYESWALRETKTSMPPGEYCFYSNIGYQILGFLLEELTGQPYADVIQSRVLEPLGMTHTHPVTTFETHKQMAIGYRDLYDDRPEHPSHGLVPVMGIEYGTGDGAQASTAADMARYLRMLLNRGQGSQSRLLSEENFALLIQPWIWTGNAYYGYGLVTYQVDDRPYIGHGGTNARYTSAILVDMEDGFGIILLTNRAEALNTVEEAAMHVLTILRGVDHHQESLPLPPATDPCAVPQAADYAGVYRAGHRVLHLTAEDGKLLLEYDGRVMALERRAQDRFYVGHPGLDLFLLEFGRYDGEVVEAFHGSHWYMSDRYAGPQRFDSPEAWEAYPGHYRAHNPELSNFRVVLRKGALALILPRGEVESLHPLDNGSFRIGEDHRSPETLRFDAVVQGCALRADYSGCPYYRTFTP